MHFNLRHAMAYIRPPRQRPQTCKSPFPTCSEPQAFPPFHPLLFLTNPMSRSSHICAFAPASSSAAPERATWQVMLASQKVHPCYCPPRLLPRAALPLLASHATSLTLTARYPDLPGHSSSPVIILQTPFLQPHDHSFFRYNFPRATLRTNITSCPCQL